MSSPTVSLTKREYYPASAELLKRFKGKTTLWYSIIVCIYSFDTSEGPFSHVLSSHSQVLSLSKYFLAASHAGHPSSWPHMIQRECLVATITIGKSSTLVKARFIGPLLVQLKLPCLCNQQAWNIPHRHPQHGHDQQNSTTPHGNIRHLRHDINMMWGKPAIVVLNLSSCLLQRCVLNKTKLTIGLQYYSFHKGKSCITCVGYD